MTSDGDHRPEGTAAAFREVTDPRAMRALAHPARIALIELLSHAGTLTATQAGDLLGESPANCAFHLRTLAKYGFVEEAGGGRGRERPWRRVQAAGFDLPAEPDSPQATRAAAALGDFLTGTSLERARTSLADRDSWPAQWQSALGRGDYLSYMTVSEARQLETDLHELLSRHSDRIGRPDRRPAGAMPIEILAIAFPLLHLRRFEDPPPGTAGAAAAPAPHPED
jgi:predicted transcriptional regulator